MNDLTQKGFQLPNRDGTSLVIYQGSIEPFASLKPVIFNQHQVFKGMTKENYEMIQGKVQAMAERHQEWVKEMDERHRKMDERHQVWVKRMDERREEQRQQALEFFRNAAEVREESASRWKKMYQEAFKKLNASSTDFEKDRVKQMRKTANKIKNDAKYYYKLMRNCA